MTFRIYWKLLAGGQNNRLSCHLEAETGSRPLESTAQHWRWITLQNQQRTKELGGRRLFLLTRLTGVNLSVIFSFLLIFALHHANGLNNGGTNSCSSNIWWSRSSIPEVRADTTGIGRGVEWWGGGEEELVFVALVTIFVLMGLTSFFVPDDVRTQRTSGDTYPQTLLTPHFLFTPLKKELMQ